MVGNLGGWFSKINFENANIRTLKLLHIFNILVVNKICQFFIKNRVGWRTEKRRDGIKKSEMLENNFFVN